jgi:phosphoribosylformylglycinamidine (FGAM) synthase-like enzyme
VEGRNATAIVIAHESHNHPSQVVPFEGAATGIGGIVRDVLCMGARVIGSPIRCASAARDPHCRYVAQGVVDGIAAYGNAIGVPTSAATSTSIRVVRRQRAGQRRRARAGQGDATSSTRARRRQRDRLGHRARRKGDRSQRLRRRVVLVADARRSRRRSRTRARCKSRSVPQERHHARVVPRVRGVARGAASTAGFKDLGAGGIMGCSAELCAAAVWAPKSSSIAPDLAADLPPEVIAIGETQERLCWIVPPSFTPVLLRSTTTSFRCRAIARGACAAVIGKVTGADATWRAIAARS